MNALSSKFVHAEVDLGGLQEVLGELVDQPLLDTHIGYGDELHLEFGAPVPYSSPALAHFTHGEWTLGARASLWRLSQPGERIVDADCTDDEIMPKLAALVGAKVTRAEMTYPEMDLTVQFGDRAAFVVPINEDNDELAAWELFTPNRLVLAAGPGRCWSLSQR